MPQPVTPFRRMGATLAQAFANATAQVGGAVGLRVALRQAPRSLALGGVQAGSSDPVIVLPTAALGGEPTELGAAIHVTPDDTGAVTTWEAAGRTDDADTGLTRIALTEPVA